MQILGGASVPKIDAQGEFLHVLGRDPCEILPRFFHAALNYSKIIYSLELSKSHEPPALV